MISLPLIRGEPSRRSVASVLCLLASNNRRALATSSGASDSICRQAATGGSLGSLRQLPVVRPDPLADCVVRDAVPSPRAAEPERANLTDELRVRWPFHAAGVGPGNAGAVPSRAAPAGAIPLCGALWPKRCTAAKTATGSPADATTAGTVGVESRGAVRADDSQVLDAVVVRHPVDVIEDHAHHRAPPDLTLTTELADRFLEPRVIQPLLEMIPREG